MTESPSGFASAAPFDVIVVGGGGTGVPFAARISEDASRRVLLLEAGPAPRTASEGPQDLRDAGTIRGADPAHPLNWDYPAHLTPTRPYGIARGRVLGGSTAINGGYFVRARRSDFDAWAAAGLPEWSYEQCLPFLRALEADADFGDTSLHGGSGPMPVMRPVAPAPMVTVTAEGDPPAGGHPVTRAFERAARAAGYPLEADKNGEQPAGWGPLPMNVRDGVRWSTALGYLLPPALPRGSRPNLVVRGDSQVRRVLVEDGRAVGVEVQTATATGCVVSEVRAAEVVLAAGAIATAQVLLLSGIGPRAELERHGIPVIADVPGVGAAFSDHPQLAVRWRPTAAAAASVAPTTMESVLNLVLPDGGELELLPLLRPLDVLLGHPDGADAPGELVVFVALQNPRSRGSIRLSSGDPDEPPALDFGYLADDRDLARLRIGVRAAVALLESHAFADVSEGVLDPDPATLASDAALDVWIRATIGTALHSCGSAPMGADGDPAAVADAHGRVRGVPGLRLADLSLLPVVPTRGPAATAVLLGERLAAFLRGE